VTDRRTHSRLARRTALAAAAACALAAPAVAAPPSRDYPPTYSSHKAPWYDPFGWFTTSQKTSTPTPAPKTESRPIPIPTRMVELPPGAAPTPAWKWYGYGTPVPGRNPFAPNGSYPGVPGNWYGASGTTPGAIPATAVGPHAPVLPEILPVPGMMPDATALKIPPAHLAKPSADPAIVIPPPTGSDGDGPKLPGTVTPPTSPTSDGDWKTAAANLKAPTADAVAAPGPDSRPAATLKAPIKEDERPTTPVATPTTPPGAALPNQSSESPDIPVDPAPGIVPPPMTGETSMADRPLTARGRAPEPDVADAIRRVCGPGIRVLEVARAGSKGVIVRMSVGNADAAWAARERLARAPELAGWRIEFELVTPVAR
jgi:eukaryotic-like serine/threonine-protein kinase